MTDNDITGGKSGSPVLDGRGRLIGLAFDGNRESMAGDVWFHPDLARTVCVDIRYVMWIIDKYAEADWLLDEMKFEKEFGIGSAPALPGTPGFRIDEDACGCRGRLLVL